MRFFFDLSDLDESMRRFSIVVPVTVFFVNLFGLWDEFVVIFNSLRIGRKVLELFVVFFLYTLFVSGLYKTVLKRPPEEMMVSFSVYVFFPLFALFFDPRIVLCVLFVVSISILSAVNIKNVHVILALRLPVLLFVLWKMTEWMR